MTITREALTHAAETGAALEVSEAELLEHAEQRGMIEGIRQTPAPHWMH